MKLYTIYILNEIKSVMDQKKAERALADIRKMRESGIFDIEKSGVEIIRKWRERRK